MRHVMAVYNVLFDIVDTAYSQKVTFPSLLDMSAAFNSFEHQMLIEA